MGRDKSSQHIYRITRHGNDYAYQQLMPVRFVPLLPNVARNEPEQVERDTTARNDVSEDDPDGEFFFKAGPAYQPA